MTLPKIPVPKVDIPFDIPLLVHSPIVHFVIAIPILVFLLEILNLFMKKRAVGGVSFFLLILGVVASVGAYFTGLTDGTSAYSTLDAAAKTALGEHKLLGVYVVLGMALVLILKILAMTGLKFFKALYMLLFMVLLILLFEQGEEGGELVFKHGVNVKKVQTLKESLADTKYDMEDLQESLEDMQDELKRLKEKEKEAVKATVEKAVEPQEVTTEKAVEPEAVSVPAPSPSVSAATDTQSVDTPVESSVAP